MQPQVNPLANLFPIILLLVIFYFMIFRPQKTEQKRRQEMLGKLAKNDDIVTTFGVHGTLVNVKEKTVVVRIDENVKIEMEKSAVGEIVKRQGDKQG